MQLTDSEVDAMALGVKNSPRKWLEKTLEKHDFTDLDMKVHFGKGQPGRQIPSLVNRTKSDLVVMGTVARTGIAGFLLAAQQKKSSEVSIAPC